jgi:hypothetical protein
VYTSYGARKRLSRTSVDDNLGNGTGAVRFEGPELPSKIVGHPYKYCWGHIGCLCDAVYDASTSFRPVQFLRHAKVSRWRRRGKNPQGHCGRREILPIFHEIWACNAALTRIGGYVT